MTIQNFKIIIIPAIVLIVVLIVFLVFKGNNNQNNMRDKFQNIRQAAVAGQPALLRKAMLAGQFYPSDKNELSAMIDDYLRQATTGNAEKAPRVLIVPHAGYVYSGRVAAYGFKALQGSNYGRVVLIGRSHQQYFDGVAADGNDIWQTPLGDVAVDKDFIAQLQKLNSAVKIDSQPHQTEHSLEVELPFLQKVLGNDFKIVPLLFGDDEPATAQTLANALAKIIDDKTAVVISSDLSHYPEYEMANELDQKTIEIILSLDAEKLHKQNQDAESGVWQGVATLACGQNAIITAMALAKKLGLKPELLKYANSGDYFAETKNRAVGYAAIDFYSQNGKGLGFTILGAGEEEIALNIARETLEMAFGGKDYQLPIDLSEIFQEERGVFVTLRKNGQLRGCIGNFTPDIGLAQNIQGMAEAAAFNDPRFMPLEKPELKDVEIEISVLSAMRKITDPNLIEVGKHGVYVKKGTRSGVYLPQVATEQGWTREQFLNSLCEEKSGIGKNCWKDGTTDLYIFTAQVFSE